MHAANAGWGRFGRRAVEADGNSANAHKWLAITSGQMTSFVPTKEKIQLGHVFKVRFLLFQMCFAMRIPDL